MERISSGQTFFMKRVFPFLWLGVVGFGFAGPLLMLQSSAAKVPAVDVSTPHLFFAMPR